jgi:predicted phosphodiesterase
MLKLAVVGDLSMQYPPDLARALDAALQAADIVVQVGDMHPAYDVVKQRLSTGRLFTIPGNHDVFFETLGVQRHWRMDYPGVHLLGIDNANDAFDPYVWNTLLPSVEGLKGPLLIFAHKPLSTILLPDGTESSHIMGEGAYNADAERMKTWLTKQDDVCWISGHYHAWTFQRTPYCDVLVEGRGGAAGSRNVGYTLFLINTEGWVFHCITL